MARPPARFPHLIVVAALLAAAALFAAAGCSQNVEKLDGRPAPPPPPSHAAARAPEDPEAQPSAMPKGLAANELASPIDQGTPPGISGTVTLAKGLEDRISPNAVLFLIAEDGSGGPPMAVRRVVGPRFPLRFFLGQESVMFEGSALEGSATLIARVSQSGTAGPAQSGDLEGTTGPVKVGAEGIQLQIDHVK